MTGDFRFGVAFFGNPTRERGTPRSAWPRQFGSESSAYRLCPSLTFRVTFGKKNPQPRASGKEPSDHAGKHRFGIGERRENANRLHERLAYGPNGSLRAIGNANLPQDILHVLFDRLDTDFERLGNFFVAQTKRDMS